MKTTSRIKLVSLLAGATLLTTPIIYARGAGGGGPPAGRPPGGGFGGGNADPMTRPSQMIRPEHADKGPATAMERGSAAPAAQDLATTMRQINQTSFEARRELLKNMDMSEEASRDALKKMQSDARNLRGEAQLEFKAAMEEVKQRKDELAQAKKAARHADAQAWEKARGALTAASQNYLEAMARLEAKKKGVPPKD
jgi:chemotaxis protein histidine kinase CheA